MFVTATPAGNRLDPSRKRRAGRVDDIWQALSGTASATSKSRQPDQPDVRRPLVPSSVSTRWRSKVRKELTSERASRDPLARPLCDWRLRNGAAIGCERHGVIDPSVDVVVVSYNSRDRLRECVEPLSQDPSIVVHVVDNASRDGSTEVVTDLPVEVIELARNVGFGGGCNAGWRAGSAPYVLFLNPDARITAEDVRCLTDVLERTSAGAVAPRVVDGQGALDWSLRRFPEVRSIYGQALFAHRLFPNARWADEVIRDPERYDREGPCDWVSGACMLVRRSSLERLDGFDEGFFMYCEDVDLCRRLWDGREAVVFTPAAVCTHAGGASAPRWSLVQTHARSRIRYAKKHFGRTRAVAYRIGVGLNALTHVLVGRGLESRIGHAQALRATLRPDTPT